MKHTREPGKKRTTRIALWVGGAVVLIAVALGVTEAVLRQAVPNSMAQIAREAVGLSADHPIDVEVRGYLTPQLIRGTFSEVRLSASDVPLTEGVRASVTAVAHDLPKDATTAELGETSLTAKFTEAELTDVLHMFSRGLGQSLEIKGDRLTVTHELSLFGQAIPITIAFAPSVVDGQLHIDPISVDAAGVLSLTVDQLADFALFKPYVNGLDVCVAEYLPRGATLESLSLSTTKTLSLTVTIDPRVGIDASLQELGTCT